MANASKLPCGMCNALETNFADSWRPLNAPSWLLPIAFLSKMNNLTFHLVKVPLTPLE